MAENRELRRFIKVGQQVMHRDRDALFGPDRGLIASEFPAVSIPQPGFMGPEYAGVVLIGQNPGAGDARAKSGDLADGTIDCWEQILAAWRDEGTVAAYWDAYRMWESDLPRWRVWGRWVQPEPAPVSRSGWV